MVSFNHIHIEILQEGIAAREFDDPATESVQGTVTKYVEIVEDRPFAIRFATDQYYDFEQYEGLSANVHIDGKLAGGRAYSQEYDCEQHGEVIDLIQGFHKVIKGRNVLKQFRFEEAKLRRTRSNERLDQLRQQFEEQGIICVEVFRCSCSDDSDGYSTDEDMSETAVPKDIVKEKGSTSKASSNIIDVPVAAPFYKTTDECSVARFRLKYRTIEALYDHEIVPRPEKDNAMLRTENEILLEEINELRKKLKENGAEQSDQKASYKRKLLAFEEYGELEVTEVKPARRRKLASDDVVIELDD